MSNCNLIDRIYHSRTRDAYQNGVKVWLNFGLMLVFEVLLVLILFVKLVVVIGVMVVYIGLKLISYNWCIYY